VNLPENEELVEYQKSEVLACWVMGQYMNIEVIKQ
jgi:hypothetical protein